MFLLENLYKYRLRPAYGSNDLLLEFFIGNSDTTFDNVLFDALNEINPRIESSEDLWLNDEVLFYVNSSEGEFILSKDIWGFVFITAEKNQTSLMKIDEILTHNPHFEKEEVNFENYKRTI